MKTAAINRSGLKFFVVDKESRLNFSQRTKGKPLWNFAVDKESRRRHFVACGGYT